MGSELFHRSCGRARRCSGFRFFPEADLVVGGNLQNKKTVKMNPHPIAEIFDKGMDDAYFHYHELGDFPGNILYKTNSLAK